MQCPTHREPLVKVRGGLSYVCPRCEFKKYIPSKVWLPPVRHTIEVPSAFAWTSWTLTNLTTDGNDDLVISSGQTIGTAVSPQIINLTRHIDRYWDCTRVKLDWTHTTQSGKISYYASNDGGAGYRVIKTEDAKFELNSGNELSQYKQQKYDDLRIKITIERTLVGDTSPSVNKVIITYNKVRL